MSVIIYSCLLAFVWNCDVAAGKNLLIPIQILISDFNLKISYSLFMDFKQVVKLSQFSNNHWQKVFVMS